MFDGLGKRTEKRTLVGAMDERMSMYDSVIEEVSRHEGAIVGGYILFQPGRKAHRTHAYQLEGYASVNVDVDVDGLPIGIEIVGPIVPAEEAQQRVDAFGRLEKRIHDDIRNLPGIYKPITDELPEVTIRRLRDGTPPPPQEGRKD